MRRSVFFLATMTLILLLAACSSGGGKIDSDMAQGYARDEPEQCVPYARRVSGIEIYGDAHTWWHQAQESRKGYEPREGAVMVLSGTRRISRGHLAVVTEIVSDSQINVTHSNWGSDSNTRRIIYEQMRVEDVSARGDWSQARFWNPQLGVFGLPYKVSGFIYP